MDEDGDFDWPSFGRVHHIDAKKKQKTIMSPDRLSIMARYVMPYSSNGVFMVTNDNTSLLVRTLRMQKHDGDSTQNMDGGTFFEMFQSIKRSNNNVESSFDGQTQTQACSVSSSACADDAGSILSPLNSRRSGQRRDRPTPFSPRTPSFSAINGSGFTQITSSATLSPHHSIHGLTNDYAARNASSVDPPHASAGESMLSFSSPTVQMSANSSLRSSSSSRRPVVQASFTTPVHASRMPYALDVRHLSSPSPSSAIMTTPSTARATSRVAAAAMPVPPASPSFRTSTPHNAGTNGAAVVSTISTSPSSLSSAANVQFNTTPTSSSLSSSSSSLPLPVMLVSSTFFHSSPFQSSIHHPDTSAHIEGGASVPSSSSSASASASTCPEESFTCGDQRTPNHYSPRVSSSAFTPSASPPMQAREEHHRRLFDKTQQATREMKTRRNNSRAKKAQVGNEVAQRKVKVHFVSPCKEVSSSSASLHPSTSAPSTSLFAPMCSRMTLPSSVSSLVNAELSHTSKENESGSYSLFRPLIIDNGDDMNMSVSEHETPVKPCTSSRAMVERMRTRSSVRRPLADVPLPLSPVQPGKRPKLTPPSPA